MKNLVVVILVAGLFVGLDCYGQQNLLKNAGFEKGKSEWKGDYDVVTENGNKVGKIELDRRKPQTIEQKIRTKGLKDLVLTFRYKTSTDLSCRGVRVFFIRPDESSTSMSSDLKPTPEWQEYTWKFGDVNEARKMLFHIEIKEGQGQVYIDDFILVPR